jgi:hypothetical protein
MLALATPHAFLALVLVCIRVSGSLDVKFWIAASFEQAFSLPRTPPES